MQGSLRGQPLAPTGCPRPASVPTSRPPGGRPVPLQPPPLPGLSPWQSRRWRPEAGPYPGPPEPRRKQTHIHTHTTQPSASFLPARPVVRTADKGRGGRRRPHQGHAEPPAALGPARGAPALFTSWRGQGTWGAKQRPRPPGPSLGQGRGPPAATPGGRHTEAGSLHLQRPPPPGALDCPVPTPRKRRRTPSKSQAGPPTARTRVPSPLLTVILEKIRQRSPPTSASRPSPTPSRRPNLPHTGLSAQVPGPSSGCGPPPLSAPALALSVDTVIRSPCVFLPGTPPPGSPPHTC